MRLPENAREGIFTSLLSIDQGGPYDYGSVALQRCKAETSFYEFRTPKRI